DADARSIIVTLDEGGAKRIQVEDDGTGIARDDLPLALARHATSKIRSLEDLEGVRSMGFRGEALASIAAVSRVSITACTRGAPHGAAIRAEGPHIGEVKPAARAPGTTVTVADLYFNTPARRKFLRSQATEFGHCDELFRRIALAHPEIAFTLKHNGRASRHLRSQPLKERVAAFLGSEFIDASLPVEAQAGTARVFGYAGSPQARAEVQYFFVNGRCVRDRVLAHAAREAYAEMLHGERRPGATGARVSGVHGLGSSSADGAERPAAGLRARAASWRLHPGAERSRPGARRHACRARAHRDGEAQEQPRCRPRRASEPAGAGA